VSERDAAALDAVVTISRALADESDLAAVLDLVAKQGRALVSARAVAIELQEGGRMSLAAVAGELPEGPDAARESAESAVLVVPLVIHGRAYGALLAVDRQDGEPRFTVADEELLESLAALAACAVAVQRLGRAQRPLVLDHVGLTGAIELLADLVESPELEIRTRFDLASEAGGAADTLDGALETAVYQIVEEALTSIVKCPAASQVGVEVVEDGEREEVRIEVRSLGSDKTGIAATLPSGQRWRSMLSID